MMDIAHGLAGLLVLAALAWLLGERPRDLPWRILGIGLLLQIVLALLLLRLPPVHALFLGLNQGVLALQEATRAGTGFVFGYLGGGEPPYQVVKEGAGFVLAFQALPLVLVMSALSALLFHWRVLPWVVGLFARLLRRSLGIGGALGLGAAMNVFVGMVEAPLLIRPYLVGMSRGELFGLMTSGMATIAGTMMVLYAGLLGPVIPEAMGHILTASVISVPAALTCAALMIPHRGEETAGELNPAGRYGGAMDAVAKGTADGVSLLLHIVAMLVVLVALVSLANQALGLLPHWGGEAVTLQRLLGVVMAPVAWLMGVPWAEAQAAGALMGVKTVLNEFLAYLQLAQLPDDTLSPRSRLIMIYALCGFANLGSLGILIGGLGQMAPERRGEIVAMGGRSIIAGTLATCMTGAVVGMVI